MTRNNASPYFESRTNVLLDSDPSVLDLQVGHVAIVSKRITREAINNLAIGKYKSCGKGITFEDVQRTFSLKKTQVQRSLKHFHIGHVLFTAGDLYAQGIYLIQNTSPQQYFPTCIKADILEDLKKKPRNVRVEPTGSNLSNLSNLSSLSNHCNALSNGLGFQKAQSFLDVLIQLPFMQLHIHRLQLALFIDKEYYQSLTNKAAPINRAKLHEENIGNRHVTYSFSPNGRAEVAIRSSDTPFKLEDDEDVAILFAF